MQGMVACRGVWIRGYTSTFLSKRGGNSRVKGKIQGETLDPDWPVSISMRAILSLAYPIKHRLHIHTKPENQGNS